MKDNTEIQKAVIAACLLESDAYPRIEGLLSEKNFGGIYAKMFLAIKKVAAKGNPIDMLTVASEANGFTIAELAACIENVNSASNIEAHAYILKEATLQKDLAALLQRSYVRIAEDDVFAVLEDVKNNLQNLESSSHTLSENFGTSIMGKTIAQIEKSRIEFLNGRPAGLETQIPIFDLVMGGLSKGELLIVAARPSHGKTNFLVNSSLAIAEKHACLVMSLEMSNIDIGRRYIANKANIPYSRLKRGTFSEREMQKVKALDPNAPFYRNLFISDKTNITLQALRSEIRAINQTLQKQGKGKLEALFIDYLQILDTAGGKGQRYELLGSIAQGLKSIAKEFDIAVCALAQTGRSVESTKKTTLADLRESGGIEQAADSIIALENISKFGLECSEYNTPAFQSFEGNRCETLFCRVLKNRNGITNDFHVFVDNANVKFYCDKTEEQAIKSLLERVNRAPKESEKQDDDFASLIEDIEALKGESILPHSDPDDIPF